MIVSACISEPYMMVRVGDIAVFMRISIYFGSVTGTRGPSTVSLKASPKVSIPRNESAGRLVAPDPDRQGHTGNKRKRECRQLESLRHTGERHLYSQLQGLAADGASRFRMRRWLQWTRKQREHKRRQKAKRTRAVLTQRKQKQRLHSKQSKANKRFKIVAWNTRGWGQFSRNLVKL